jgi:gamma-glutamyltranspeptidase
MWEEYGEEEWSRLFEPAVGYAEEGFVIGEETAGWIGSEYPAFPAHAQEIYGRTARRCRQATASCRKTWPAP